MTFLSNFLRFRIVFAVVRRDFLTARSYRLAFVLDLVLGVLNLLVYFFISRIVSGVPASTMSGAPDYFSFAVVGLAISLVIQAASVGLARRVREEQLTGTLEALLTEPISSVELALGLAGFPFAFAIVRATLYLGVAVLVLGMAVQDGSLVGFVVVMGFTGLALAGIGICLGAVVIALKRGEALATLVSFAFGLLGGAVFPRSVLPDWLATVSEAVPTRFAFDGVRSALFLGDRWQADAVSLGIFSIVALPVSVLLFKWALDWAQRKGSLGDY